MKNFAFAFIAFASFAFAQQDPPLTPQPHWQTLELPIDHQGALDARWVFQEVALHGKYALPDRKMTPGAVNQSCVADLSRKPHKISGIEENICAKDFRTGPIRATIRNFPKLKKEACAEYGVAKCDASVEGDHFLPIEACGKPDDIRNIWAQPMDQARVKDHQVEDVLPKLICSGKIKLSDAQKCIADDWVKCADRLKSLQ